ncbi:MAG: hypothetical protein KAU90_04530 [Sulfurovaceae bacterium]|nr:hypothetical protein [Sulfurovaceae bacterium]
MYKNIKKIFIFLLILLFGYQIVGCGSSGTTPSKSNKKILLKIEGIVRKAINKDIDITLLGAKAYNAQGSVISKVNIKANETKNLTLYVKSSSSDDLRVLVKIENYIDNGITIQPKSVKDGDEKIIQMIPAKSGKVKDGIFVQIAEITGVDSDGITEKEIRVEAKENKSATGTSIVIPKGTRFTDKNGNPVTPNRLTLVHFDPQEAGVLDAYPGGLEVMADVDGNMEQVHFKSAGFASIVLEDSNGNKVNKATRPLNLNQNNKSVKSNKKIVDNLSNPVTVTMEIQKGIRDGEGNLVENGDTIPVWGYDVDEGTWVYKKNVLIRDINDSKIGVIVNIGWPITYINCDWKIPPVRPTD